MRLDLDGRALGRGHVDGAPLPDVGGTDYCWFAEDVPICAAGNTIQKYEASAWQLVALHGANFLRAGHGRYFTEGSGWAPTDVDPHDGTAVLTHYDIGRDIRLVAMDGSARTISTGVLGRDAIAYHNVRRRFGFLLFQADGLWSLSDDQSQVQLPIAPRVEAVDYAVPVQVDGGAMLLERANGRLTLRRPHETFGWLVHEDPRPNGLVVPDGMQVGSRVRVTWSNDQSESAAVWGQEDVELDPEKRIDLNWQELPPIDAIPLLGRTFGVGVYSFNDAASPGQILLPVRPTRKLWGQPIILPSDRPDLAEGNYVWAVYAGENAGLSYERAIQQARPLGDSLRRGLLAYKDSYPLPTSFQLKPHDVAGCILIRGANEPIPDFKKRCRESTGDWPSVHLADTEARACETFQAVCEVAKEGHLTGFNLFAAGRPGVPWAALEPRIERLMSGITGTPAARIIPDIVEPTEDPMRVFLYDESKKANANGWTDGYKFLGTKVSVPNASDGGYGLRLANGKVRALNPNGDWEERDQVGGDVTKPGQSWELFYPAKPGGMSAPRNDRSFYFQTIEMV